ncbi:MAG: hypothetical protein IPI64_05535 [Chloracidobacterium sp.]|nr:hypothetical protein [Chloracidobacterium sp.]
MEITRTARPAGNMADVKIWHCGGCGVVHMSVKDKVLNFDREEFAMFTEAVVDINYSGWQSEHSIIDLGEHDVNIYAKEIVH